jgi:hypothetical protein
MSCDAWINRNVQGKTFADVGGLWGTVNEKVSVAAKAGARETTMIDITPLGHDSWAQFYQRCEERGIVCGRSISANVDSPEFSEKAGMYDVVHCSGVIYHCPNPLHTVAQLASISREILIVGSTVIPHSITNSRGTIKMEKNSALFVPALSEHQRAVVTEFLEEVGAKAYGINLPLSDGWSLTDYAPWWYLFTGDYVAGLLEVCRFKVLERASVWEGKAAYFLAKRI